MKALDELILKNTDKLNDVRFAILLNNVYFDENLGKECKERLMESGVKRLTNTPVEKVAIKDAAFIVNGVCGLHVDKDISTDL